MLVTRFRRKERFHPCLPLYEFVANGRLWFQTFSTRSLISDRFIPFQKSSTIIKTRSALSHKNILSMLQYRPHISQRIMDRTWIVSILGLLWFLSLLQCVYHSIMTYCQMADIKRQVWVLSADYSFITNYNVRHCSTKIFESRPVLSSSRFFYTHGFSVISFFPHA